MRPEVVGFDTGVTFGLGVGMAIGLGWWFIVSMSILVCVHAAQRTTIATASSSRLCRETTSP